jgi:torulene dioxygenase
VVAEIPVFPNIDILKKFYLNRLVSSAPDAAAWKDKGRPRFTRFRIPLSETSARNVETLWAAGEDQSMELPAINPKYRLRAHRYTYGIADRGQGTFADGLVKYDSVARSAKLWCVLGHTPGEAIFVSDPDGVEEDDGVLLSVVLDGWKGTSYLVVLDSRSMVEVGRAEMNTAFPFGFHGNFTGRPKVNLRFDD